MERLIDMAARKLALDPKEMRLRNLVGDDEFPYKVASGLVWDRAAFKGGLERGGGDARVTLGIDLVVLVGQVLELDGAIDAQRVAGRPFQIAASLLVARVRGPPGAFDLGQHRGRDQQVALGPRGFFAHRLTNCSAVPTSWEQSSDHRDRRRS